jgi:secondary thiamine-phosphate synthase enzyme
MQKIIQLRPRPRGMHLITDEIASQLPELPDEGLLHLFLQHTSAGLMINENADPSVRIDLEAAFDRLAPENHPSYTHTMEGPDDMPAHIKAALGGISLMIPVRGKRMALGTWQGIYLCEYRIRAGSRSIIATLLPG